MRKPGKHALLFDPKDPRCVSRCKQSFTDAANINKILAKYIKVHGDLDLDAGCLGGMFADVSDGDDYRSVLDKVNAAKVAFDALESGTRARFRNSVSEALDFVADPANLDEAVELGLIEAPEQAPAAPLEPANGPEDDAPIPVPATEPSGAPDGKSAAAGE